MVSLPQVITAKQKVEYEKCHFGQEAFYKYNHQSENTESLAAAMKM